MTVRTITITGAALIATMAPAAAVAPDVSLGSGQFAFGISGFVPVICRTNLDATSVAPTPGVIRLGSLSEFCNSPKGYRVHADYSPSLAKAQLIVDGRPVPLGKSGSSVISQSNRASISAREPALELPQAGLAGQISFRIEPL